MNRFKLLPLAGILAMGLFVAESAHAGAYGLASNDIRNFTITPGSGISFTASVDTSSTSALLNGAGAGPFGGAGVTDAPVAVAPGSTITSPPSPPASAPQFVNNGAFTPAANVPVGPVGSFSYADALISHPGGGIFDARIITEAHLDTAGTASGTATNSSATGFTANFTSTGAPGQTSIDFRFIADPLIRVFLNANAAPGSFAQGTLSAALTISCASASGCGATPLGGIVFAFAPNGVVSGTTGVTGTVGGNEIADSENLQASLTQFTPGGQQFSIPVAFLPYEAVTNDLPSGSYTLGLAMTATDAVIKKLPEPGSTALVALGLVGLGFAGRRRNKG